jgi:hypothetical protein
MQSPGHFPEFEVIQAAESAIAQLQAQTRTLAGELHQSYGNYLTALAQAVRHHSIQAVYYLCTQVYPEAFLKLDASQQQGLQRSLRRTITNSVIDLLSQLQIPKDITEPAQLLESCRELEEAIEHSFPSLSKKLNHLLQQAQIVPQQLPRRILEAALRLEEVSDYPQHHPNILTVTIDKESSHQSERPPTQTMQVIFLRSGDMEFSDLKLSRLRQELQALQGKVASLRRNYQHRQHQSQGAAATVAWHQSWFGLETDTDLNP